MANEGMITVICPKCKKESQFLSYKCINATDENGLKEKVRDCSLFLHTCPHCEAKVNVEYPFLYHQVEDGFMIHYAITDENAKSIIDMLTNPTDIQKDMVKTLSGRSYIIRLVRSKAVLLEKIAIYEAGMDDRAVEIAKVIVGSKFMQENPDKMISQILFVMTADAGRLLQIYVDNKPVAQAELTSDLYKKVVDDFLSKLKPLRNDKNIIVNAAWASEIVKAYKK